MECKTGRLIVSIDDEMPGFEHNPYRNKALSEVSVTKASVEAVLVLVGSGCVNKAESARLFLHAMKASRASPVGFIDVFSISV